MPETFFDRTTLISLPGCVMVVSVISNGLRRVFRFDPKWFALALSILLCVLGAVLSNRHALIDYFLALLNGFLVFTSAAGLSQIGARLQRPVVRKHSSEGGNTPFFTAWFSE